MEKLVNNIFVDRCINEPLSADSFYIFVSEGVYVYDVGNEPTRALKVANMANKKIILSHFHKDHIENMKYIESDDVFSSNVTYKKINKGIIVADNLKLKEASIHVLPSSHAKGCLALKYQDYLFVGDAIYPDSNGMYNVQKLQELINKLQEINVKYLVLSHTSKLIYQKEIILNLLEMKYNKKKRNEAFLLGDISYED